MRNAPSYRVDNLLISKIDLLENTSYFKKCIPHFLFIFFFHIKNYLSGYKNTVQPVTAYPV